MYILFRQSYRAHKFVTSGMHCHPQMYVTLGTRQDATGVYVLYPWLSGVFLQRGTGRTIGRLFASIHALRDSVLGHFGTKYLANLYGYGSKLGTPKLWMVNTQLDIHICGPTSVFHFDPHPYTII